MLKRQLRAVQADRAAIKPLISATLVGRTSVETAFRQLAALAAMQRAAPRWSGVIGELGVRLDEHAYLDVVFARATRFHPRGRNRPSSAARAFGSR